MAQGQPNQQQPQQQQAPHQQLQAHVQELHQAVQEATGAGGIDPATINSWISLIASVVAAIRARRHAGNPAGGNPTASPGGVQ